jgi:pyruvate dehydrogenase E2 component (dihydrolipoamide acetyltransferase)
MANDVVMPRLSDSMEEGTILKWLVEEGAEVKRGEPIVEIETDKANMTYEADTDGTLVEIVAEEGATLPIGEVIARIGEAGEAPAKDDGAPARAKEESEPESESEERAAPAATKERKPQPSGDGRMKASPVARRMADELGVELARLEGSGPGGRIVKADVEAAAGRGAPEREAAPTPAAAGEAGAKGESQVQDLTRLQQTVSRRMAESKATAPDFQLNVEVDMTACVELRERLKRVADPAPSFNDMVVKASANALREFPRANGAYRDGRWELYSRVNVGVAVAAHDALVVPTIFDADLKGLRQIASEARALAQRVRDGTVTPPELSGGTFTVSNLGMYGISNFQAVINPPQAGILAIGAITETPVVRDGEITTAHLMGVTLACDHRVLYGADGATFLGRVRALLEEPLGLAL